MLEQQTVVAVEYPYCPASCIVNGDSDVTASPNQSIGSIDVTPSPIQGSGMRRGGTISRYLHLPFHYIFSERMIYLIFPCQWSFRSCIRISKEKFSHINEQQQSISCLYLLYIQITFASIHVCCLVS